MKHYWYIKYKMIYRSKLCEPFILTFHFISNFYFTFVAKWPNYRKNKIDTTHKITSK